MTDDVVETPRRRLWLFDRPLWRDWLLWLALAGGVGSALVVFNGERWYRTSNTPVLTLSLAFAVQFVLGSLAVGVVGAVVREYFRGRHDPIANRGSAPPPTGDVDHAP